MPSRVIFKILLIILLILLATPLLSALATMGTGSSMLLQMPINGRMIGLATIWILLLLLLIVAAIVSVGRSIRRKRDSERDKAA